MSRIFFAVFPGSVLIDMDWIVSPVPQIPLGVASWLLKNEFVLVLWNQS